MGRARELGSYRLGELLGRGGMGEVYLATHRMLARPAAIKLIRPEALAGEDGTKAQLATARFRREAEAAARLKSPHTVQLYDFGVTDEGRLYLVMELLEGLDLDSLVRRDGPLPAARVVHILRQVCESLEEAHDAGLVHRDIKPANIHLGRVGREPDFVKVLDFGLVKSIEGTGGDDPAGHRRRHDAGHAGLHGARDGAIAKRSTGARTCTRWGASPTSCSPESSCSRGIPRSRRCSCTCSRSRCRRRSGRENPIPPALERLILTCLAKQPEDRPASAADVAAELGQVEGAGRY